MVALLLVTFRAVEPFLAWHFSAFIGYISVTSDIQHGERMATWALRTCLLHGHQPAAEVMAGSLGGNKERVLTTWLVTAECDYATKMGCTK